MGCCLNQKEEIKYPHTKSNSINDYDIANIHSSNVFPSNINDPIAVIDRITMNPLGLALWFGQLQTFTLLQNERGASFEYMEILFQKQGQSGIDIAISKGHSEIIECTLPNFLLYFNKNFESFKKPLIHKIIERENLRILTFIYNYFIFVRPPPSFNVHFIDPITQENSALVACRTRNLHIIKYLNEVCEVDFSLINSKGLNALHVAATTNKKNISCLEVIKYLINECKVDVTYEYQILLLKIHEIETIKFVEDELKKIGIATKRDYILGLLNEKRKKKFKEDAIWEEHDQDSEFLTDLSAISMIENEDSTVTHIKEKHCLYDTFEVLTKN